MTLRLIENILFGMRQTSSFTTEHKNSNPFDAFLSYDITDQLKLKEMNKQYLQFMQELHSEGFTAEILIDSMNLH